MESSYVLSPLRPQKKEVRLHDGGSVSVPVFDAKAMILDLLTNPSLMKTNNLAKCYDVLTGNVDDNVMSNKKYGEIHTGDEWLPARNRFCSPPDDFHNDMPVGLVIFGDKSHTDLHGSLALTPIIFTLNCLIKHQETIRNFGVHLDTHQIFRMERIRLIKQPPMIKYKMNIIASWLYLNL
jgi:hypothetical protein